MSNLIKSTAIGLGLLAGVSMVAQAQTVSNAPAPGQSIASLPPVDQGPRPSSHTAIPAPAQVQVNPSGNYPGPAAGAGTGQMPPLFAKPADWDQNVSLHPYTSGQGPKPH